MATVRIEKVLANAQQSFTDTEKERARKNIDAGTVNGTFIDFSQGSGERTTVISNMDVNKTDTAAVQTNKIDFKDNQNNTLGSYWLLPSTFTGIPLFAGNGVSRHTPPQLKKVFNDCISSVYDSESSTIYNWVYVGGASKNKAIQKIENLSTSRNYLIYYRVCLNSTNKNQCVCLNQGDSTFSFDSTNQWFRYICDSGNSTYPYQHNITYVTYISGVNQCYVALVGDWSTQPSRTKVQMLNHQCYVFEVS